MGLALVTTWLAPPSTAARLAPRQPAGLNGCWNPDHGKPVLDDLSVSAQTVDVSSAPATLTYTAVAHDTGGPGEPSGVKFVMLRVQEFWDDSPHPGRADATTELFLDPQGGAPSYSGDYVVARDAHAMQVRVTRVKIVVKHGGIDATVDPTALGLDPTVDVSSAHPDTHPPTLTGFQISPNPVSVSGGPALVHVTASVSDDDSGIHEFALEGVPGTFPVTSGPGEFSADIPVHRWSRAHIPLGVRLVDEAHNSRSLTSDDVAAAGFDSVIDVTGGNPDLAPPKATLLSASPDRVDVRHGAANWHVKVRATDPSGIRDLTIRSVHPLPRPTSGMPTTAPVKGVYSFPVHIVRCVHGPGPLPLILFVQDNTYRVTTLRIHGPRVVSSDHLPPTVRLRRGALAQAYVATFSEPVHGIASSHVLASASRDPGDAVTGTWTCFRHRTGPERASCRTGEVQRARFAAAGARAVRTIDFEPDHHLDVLDDNGNPLTHDGLSTVRRR
jgi:hypothetical protein